MFSVEMTPLPKFKTTMIATLLCLASAATLAHPTSTDAMVGTLITKELAELPGKEALMITVDYPPGAVDPIHRHDAHAFVYVVEGTIVMGLKGGKEVKLTKGQTFYEGPNDIHTVGRNASQTLPAKFVVWMVKNKDVPFFIPLE